MENENLSVGESASTKSETNITDTHNSTTETDSTNVKKIVDDGSSVETDNLVNNLAEKINTSTHITNDNTDSAASVETKDVEDPNTLIKNVCNLSINEKVVTSEVKREVNSSVELKQATDSLKNIANYRNSSSDDSEDSESDSASDGSSDSSEESDSSSDSSTEDEEDIRQTLRDNTREKRGLVDSQDKDDATYKIYADSDKCVLPPCDISRLEINVEAEEFLHMGHVLNVIQNLITVESIPTTPTYDLDTILFIEVDGTKKPLGAVYDVLGPISGPMYVLRMESKGPLSNLNVTVADKVYCAPKSQYTKYVFVKELLKVKGSDASWVNDIEIPPEIAAQLSDDEDPEACVAEGSRQPTKRKHTSRERHESYEKNMNLFNTLVSQPVHRPRQHQPRGRHNPRPWSGRRDSHGPPAPGNVYLGQGHRRPQQGFPPAFNPAVPPPGYPSQGGAQAAAGTSSGSAAFGVGNNGVCSHEQVQGGFHKRWDGAEGWGRPC